MQTPVKRYQEIVILETQQHLEQQTVVHVRKPCVVYTFWTAPGCARVRL